MEHNVIKSLRDTAIVRVCLPSFPINWISNKLMTFPPTTTYPQLPLNVYRGYTPNPTHTPAPFW